MSWLGTWREECPPVDDDNGDDGGLDISDSSSDFDSDGGAPPAVTTSA
jgi:hypothetical protein